MEFKDRLKDLRLRKDMTRYDLAKEIEVSQYSIAGYERGDRLPGEDALIKMARIFNVSIDYLLNGEDKKENQENLDLQKEMADTEENMKLICSNAGISYGEPNEEPRKRDRLKKKKEEMEMESKGLYMLLYYYYRSNKVGRELIMNVTDAIANSYPGKY